MANDFSKDGNCKAAWLYEDLPGFMIDSKGNNDLTNAGANQDDEVFREGLKSAKFVAANNDDVHIPDPDLDVGFSFRFTDGIKVVKDITYCGWVHFNSLPSTEGTPASIYYKYEPKTFLIYVLSDEDKLILVKGYNAGASVEYDSFATGFQVDTWYHLGIGYRESDKSYYIRIWDDTANDFLDADTIGSFSEETSVLNSTLYMGIWEASLNLDETIIWNVKKSLGDVDRVRNGSYTYGLRFSDSRLDLGIMNKLNL